MSTTEGSKKVRPKNSPWNETQPQLNGRTVEITPPPAPLRDPSISGSERLRRPRFEQAPYDFAADQGSSRGNLTYEPATTYAGSVVTDQMSQLHGGDNNQADNASIISYNSTRDVTQFIREINGRIFNNLNDSYFLPSDEPEWVRLEKQSVALVLAMGGLYLCPEVTEAILNPADGQPKRILDLGCGTGSWACEMARRFPHASVLGVDLAPPPVDTGAFPPNLRFEIDDINLGLAHFYDQFDLVHARCVSGGINDMDKTIVEFQRCLKPGGFLIIMEGDHMYETRHKLARLKKMRGDPDVSAVSENGSYLRRMIVEVCEAGTLAGSCINRAGELIDWGLWEYPLIDPDTCRSGGFYLPIGPWARAPTTDDTQMLHYAGTLMRQSFLNIHRAYHKIFFQHGMSQEVLNEWSHHIDDELTRQTQKIWVRFQFCWGRRRAANGLPAPPLPPRPARGSPTQSPPSSPQEENPSVPSDIRDFRRAPGYHYPAIEIFTTPEDARNDRAHRQASKGEMPELMVRKAWRLLQQQQAQQATTD